jgi:hypothetical protein
MPRREGGQAPGLEVAAVGVGLYGEQDLLVPDVLLPIRAGAGVPDVLGEVLVGAVEELLALFGVLGDEQDVGRAFLVAVGRIAPP